MPPFIPKQVVPFPAPTSPSSKSLHAPSMAARTSGIPMTRSVILLRLGVVALAHHWIHGGELHAVPFTLLHHIIHQRVMDLSHVQGIGQGKGDSRDAQLLDLGDAGGLSKAVMDKGRCRRLEAKIFSSQGRITVTPVLCSSVSTV